MSVHCNWCGRFVPAGTEPTTRCVHGVRDGVLAWRTVSQVLCPECSASWSLDMPWNKAVVVVVPVSVQQKLAAS